MTMSIDQYYGERSPEALANLRFPELDFSLLAESDPLADEVIIALTASYRALERYLNNLDELYIPPRNASELKSILHRYAHDAIHNIVSSNINSLRMPGAYSRVCHGAESSLNALLQTNRNAEILIALSSQPVAAASLAVPVSDHNLHCSTIPTN